jgi:O-antigen ligase
LTEGPPFARCGDRLSGVVIAGAIILVPVALAPGSFISYDVTPKLLVLLMAFAVLLLLPPVFQGGLSDLRQSRSGQAYIALIVLEVLGILLSSICSPTLGLAIAGTVFRRFGLVSQLAIAGLGLFTAIFVSRRRELRSTLLSAVIAAGTVEACYAIAQFAGFDPVLSPDLYTYLGSLRPPASMGHALYLGGLLLVSSAVAISRVFGERSLGKQGLYAVSGLVQCVAILLTGTRSAMAGLLVGCVYIAIRMRGASDRRTLVLLAGIPLSLATLAGLLLLSRNEPFRHRLGDWVADYKGGPRLILWRDSLKLISASGFIGFGPDTFMREFPLYESAELSSRYPDFVHEAPHNVYLDYLTTEGIIGLAGFVGLVSLALLNCERRGESADPVYVGMQAALIASIVWMFFANLTIANALFIRMLISLTVADYPSQPEPAPAQSPAAKRIFLALRVTLAAAAATLGAAYAWNDWQLHRARIFLSQGMPELAQSAYESACRFSFPGPAQDEWYSELMARYAFQSAGADGPTAWMWARQASARAETHSEESASAFYQSGLLALIAGNDDLAERKLRLAILQWPTWYRPHLLLAQVFLRSGRAAQAASEGRTALSLSGRFEPRVREALLHPERGPV